MNANLSSTASPPSRPTDVQPSSDNVVLGFTRDSVRDVFVKMLGMEMVDEEPSPLPGELAGQIAGSVGFVGKATGVVYLHTGVGLGKTITGKMLGLSEADVDDEMLNDAFGELCNMVVGAVKSRLCDCGRTCVLTIPSIMRGSGLRIQDVANSSRHVLGFRAGDKRLVVEVTVNGPAV